MIDLTGKAAVVTGGSRGIGKAIALRLAQQGADICFSKTRNVAAKAVASVPEPVDWSSVDPIPERLRQVLERNRPQVSLDDVVLDEPEPARRDEVLA